MPQSTNCELARIDTAVIVRPGPDSSMYTYGRLTGFGGTVAPYPPFHSEVLVVGAWLEMR